MRTRTATTPDGGGHGGSGGSGGLDLDGFDEGVAVVLLLVVDVVVVVALLVAGAVARVVLRRSWEVVACGPAEGAPVEAARAVRASGVPRAS